MPCVNLLLPPGLYSSSHLLLGLYTQNYSLEICSNVPFLKRGVPDHHIHTQQEFNHLGIYSLRSDAKSGSVPIEFIAHFYPIGIQMKSIC